MFKLIIRLKSLVAVVPPLIVTADAAKNAIRKWEPIASFPVPIAISTIYNECGPDTITLTTDALVFVKIDAKLMNQLKTLLEENAVLAHYDVVGYEFTADNIVPYAINFKSSINKGYIYSGKYFPHAPEVARISLLDYKPMVFYPLQGTTLTFENASSTENHTKEKEDKKTKSDTDNAKNTKSELKILLETVYKQKNTSMESIGRALRYAAAVNNHQHIPILLETGIQVDCTEKDSLAKRTALHWAIYKGSVESVRALLKAGADVTLSDGKKTAKDYAAESKNPEIRTLLGLKLESSNQNQLKP